MRLNNLHRHLNDHVAHAKRTKHCVLAFMIASAVLVAFGFETWALMLHWAANLVWIYET